MLRRASGRTAMGTAAAATAACTALVVLPASFVLSAASEPAPAPAAQAAAAPTGPVLQPALTQHLRSVGARTPVRVMVQADGDTAAAKRALRGAGLAREITLDKVGIVVGVGTPRQVRALRDTAATRVDWADEEVQYYSNTSHKATRGYDVHEGAFDVDGDGHLDGFDGSGTSVAVIDSGTDGTHPMFDDASNTSRVRKNVKIVCSDVVNVLQPGAGTLDSCAVDATAVNDTDTPSVGGHGTHVAGIAAGGVVTDSAGRELRGAAPGADIVSVSTGATLSIYGGTLGMYWVLEHHEDPCAAGLPVPGTPSTCDPVVVVNNSWGPTGGGTFSPTAPQVVVQRKLVQAGVAVVWAAGNDGGDGSASTMNPYTLDPTGGVLSVANYDDGGVGSRDNAIAPSSSRGSASDATTATYPDLAAPGTDITSACRPYLPVCATGLDLEDPDYNTISGTSMAAPHVAGYVAVLQQIALETGEKKLLTPQAVEDLLVNTAHQFGETRDYLADQRNPRSTSGTSFDAGHGLVDVAAAAAVLIGSPATVTDPQSCPADARFTDPAGDASGALGVPTTPALSVDALDILEGWLTTNAAKDAVTFHVRLTDIPELPVGLEGTGEYFDLNFALGGASYYLGAYRILEDGLLAGDPSAVESFVLGDFGADAGRRRTLATGLTGSFDAETDVLTVQLRSSDLVAAGLAPLTEGDEISGLSFVARRSLVLLVPDADTAKGACAYEVGAAVTPEPTATATATATSTATATATATSSATATGTATTTTSPSDTATATTSPTGTATATTSPTGSASTTATATVTETVVAPGPTTTATATATATVPGPTTTATATETTTTTATATATSTATETVTTSPEPGNRAPVIEDVDVRNGKGRYRAGQRLRFRVSATDEDGDRLRHRWSFGDGDSARGRKAGHRYDRKGHYRVVLTVTDGTDTTRMRFFVKVGKRRG